MKIICRFPNEESIHSLMLHELRREVLEYDLDTQTPLKIRGEKKTRPMVDNLIV